MTNRDARWIQAALIVALGIVAAGAAGPWIPRIGRGIDPRWFHVTVALAVVCAATGGLGAWIVRAGRTMLSGLLIWLVVCAVGSYLAVGLFMVGGAAVTGAAAAWNFGFWIVTAVGWLPAYLFFFGYFSLLFSLSPRINHEISRGSPSVKPWDTGVDPLSDASKDERLR